MVLARNELVEALLNAFQTMAVFDQMMSNQLNIRRERIIAGTGGEGADVLVAKVVADYDSKNNALTLIRAAVAQNPANPKLQDFITKYPEWNPARMAAQTNPFETVIMRGYRVFVRRHQLRQALKTLGDPPNSRVLAIDGERCSGKTYSRDFLSYLVEIHPPWAGSRLVTVDLDKRKYDSLVLAKEIGAQLPLDDDPLGPDKHEQASRRLPDLVTWIGRGILKPNVNAWWIVLDGFRVEVHPDETHDLIRSLIDKVDNEWGGKARLILLNYSKFLDEDIKTFIMQETIDPVERTDVEDFFRCVYAQSGQVPGDEIISQTVEKVLSQVEEETLKRGGGECARLKVLSIGLTKAAKNLLCKT